jgi:hypothetical protein
VLKTLLKKNKQRDYQPNSDKINLREEKNSPGSINPKIIG